MTPLFYSFLIIYLANEYTNCILFILPSLFKIEKKKRQSWKIFSNSTLKKDFMHLFQLNHIYHLYDDKQYVFHLFLHLGK